METVYSSMPWAKDIVSTASPILDALRWLGYGLLRILAYLVDVLYIAIQGLLGINILKIGPVQAFVKRVSPLGWSVLTIALIGAFILLMLYPSHHKGNIARGMFMSVLLMVSIPFMFQMLNSFKDAGVADVSRTISESDSPGQAILIDNTYDVARSTSRVANISSASDPYYLDVNARIPKSNKTFNKKITSVQNGVTYGEELGNGFFGWGEERLYAYNFRFVEPLFTLLIMLICLLFTGFKLGRLMFDLITHQIIAPVVFASDVADAGRSKKLMQSLISNYILMVIILVLLKVYIDLTAWSTSGVSDIWVRILLIAGASWGVIDGPDIILKLIGVDAGVRSATSVLVGANTAVNMGRSAGGAVTGAIGTAGSAIRNAPGNIAGMAGSAAGAVSGLKGMAGFAEMGAGLATNGQARSDAGVSGVMDMRNAMRSGSGGGTGGSSSGYDNVPKTTWGERFSSAQDKAVSGIGRTAATVGYAAGKAADKVIHTVGTVAGTAATPSIGVSMPPPSATPYPETLPKTQPTATPPVSSSVKPGMEQSNYQPPEPPDNDTI